tara:strand:- start:140 stop:1030 length:891 start_codon:yes stop_codon:yes gene_type:complete
MPIKPKRGFTLIELLVVIAIIAVLVGLTVVVAGAMMDRAKLTKDLSNNKTIAQANWSHSTDNKGRLFSPRIWEVDQSFDEIDDETKNSINSRLWMKSFDDGVDADGLELPLAFEDGVAYQYIGNIEAYKSPLDPHSRLRSYSLSAYIGVEYCIDEFEDYSQSSWQNNFVSTLTASQISHPGKTLCSITEDEVRNNGVNVNGFMMHPRYVVPESFPIWWYDFPALWSPDGVAVSNMDGSVELVPLTTDALHEGWDFIRENLNGSQPEKWVDLDKRSKHDYDLLRKKMLPGHIGSILD